MKTEFITFLWVGSDGRLHTDIEVAVYADGQARHVFAAGLDAQELFQFDRTEHYIEADSHASGGPWRGKKHFGQKGPGANVRKQANRWMIDRVREARAHGDLLGLALEVAERERDAAEAWTEARVRHLMTLDAEAVRRNSGSLLSAIGLATYEADEAHERWSRLLTFATGVRALKLAGAT